jgi:inorganic pyrophosphatase
MADDKGRDQKILCVPRSDPLWNYIKTIEQVPPHLLKEITHFFETYKNLEGKNVMVFGWKGLEPAVYILEDAKSRYAEQNK